MRVQTPPMVLPRWRSMSSWVLKVALTDSMIWRSGLKNFWPGSGSLALAGFAKQIDSGLVQAGLEEASVVGLVGDHDLSTGSGQARGGSQDRFEDLAFVGLGAGQRPPHGQAVQGADQMQPQTPEEPTV